jgi:hypothetical protein
MDNRKNNGGNKNAGRKPKAEEQKLIEKLSPLEPLAHAKLKEAIESNQKWAVQLYFNYMYGKPRETKDITLNAEQPLFDF